MENFEANSALLLRIQALERIVAVLLRRTVPTALRTAYNDLNNIQVDATCEQAELLSISEEMAIAIAGILPNLASTPPVSVRRMTDTLAGKPLGRTPRS